MGHFFGTKFAASVPVLMAGARVCAPAAGLNRPRAARTRRNICFTPAIRSKPSRRRRPLARCRRPRSVRYELRHVRAALSHQAPARLGQRQRGGPQTMPSCAGSAERVHGGRDGGTSPGARSLKGAPRDEARLYLLAKLDLNEVWLNNSTLGRRKGFGLYKDARRAIEAVLGHQPEQPARPRGARLDRLCGRHPRSLRLQVDSWRRRPQARAQAHARGGGHERRALGRGGSLIRPVGNARRGKDDERRAHHRQTAGRDLPGKRRATTLSRQRRGQETTPVLTCHTPALRLGHEQKDRRQPGGGLASVSPGEHAAAAGLRGRRPPGAATVRLRR